MPLLRTRMSDIATPLTTLADTDAMAVDADQGASVFLYRKMTGAKFKELVRALNYESKLLSNVGLSVVANTPTNGLTIALKQKDGATDPGITSDKKVLIAFRSATLTSGLVVYREVTAALSTIITSGSTVGFFAAKAERLHIYAIDNAGTVELAYSGSNTFNEADLQTTTAEGGAGAADSKTVLYSTTARSNVAIRYLGFAMLTEATPGTWVMNPSQIVIGSPARVSVENGVIADTGNGRGSTDTRIRRFTNTTNIGTGSAITHTTNATNGSTFTVNEDGLYFLGSTDGDSTAAHGFGISVNSNQLTTSIASITAANRLGVTAALAATTFPVSMGIVVRLRVGDIVRAHTNTAIGDITTLANFIVRKIGE